MAKIKNPAPVTETPAPEAPAPDMSILISTLTPILGTVVEVGKKMHGLNKDLAISCIEFREKYSTASRNDIELSLETAVATAYGLKLSQVQNDKKPGEKGYSAYTLVSAIMTVAWPKGETEQKRVAKAFAEDKGWVELRKAASKKQSRPSKDPNANKCTPENFVNRLHTFLVTCQTDMDTDLLRVLSMAEAAIVTIEKATKDTPK